MTTLIWDSSATKLSHSDLNIISALAVDAVCVVNVK